MKKGIVISLILVLIMTLGSFSVVMAKKPQENGAGKDVIALSNGFPSGAHETLNIHGKKADYVCVECEPCSNCDPPIQCNVVNIPEYTAEVDVPVTISYVSGRKVKIDELTVFDSCAGFDTPNDEDGAEVWLPYEPEGYWVFARALGKPAKGDPSDPTYEPRRIIFQNDEGSPIAYSLFGDVENPDQVEGVYPLGVITKDGAYKVMSTNELDEYLLVRFDDEPAGKGKGKNVGKDVTDMFMWSGWVFHGSLDLNGDQVVNELDVEYACWSAYDTNSNGVIDYDPDLLAIGDANGDLTVDRLDLAYVAPCAYDLDSNGVIDATEFQGWLDANQEGWVFPLGLDLNGDGVVDHLDVEYECWSAYDTNSNGVIDYDPDLLAIGDANGDLTVDRLDLAYVAPCAYDLDSNGVIDPFDDSYSEGDEFENWLEDKIPGDQTEADFWVDLWEHYETPVWVFTIADLVYHNQVVVNEGIKNLQIRFYPVATTEFERKNRIIVDKVTDPAGSAQSFDFTLDGPGNFHAEFSLTDEASPYTSVHLEPGVYTVEEIVPAGWDVTGISPDDDNSTGDTNTATATISLEAGETVTVTFNNTEQ